MTHISGDSRYQTEMFAPSLDELVRGDHPVRVIDAFVDSLDLLALGFSKVATDVMGRPRYHPSDLLKLYIYGYQHQMRSSRRLESEAERNLEVLWLIRRLSPSFKTIADFRRDHAKAIVGVCRSFVQFCRGQSLYGGEVVAVDGTKIEAVASRKRVITPKSLERQAAALDTKITEYLAAMDTADQQAAAPEPQPADVAKALQALQAQRDAVTRKASEMAAAGLSQEVEGEDEARLMRTAHHGYQVAYNAQTAVDAKHGLIAAFELTSDGNDQCQLYPMAQLACQELAVDAVTVVADTGYSSGEQGKLCAEAGITAIVPRPETVNPKGQKYFSRDAFQYDKASDTWQCPAGETLTCREVSQTEQKKKYWSMACAECPMKARCTAAEKRIIVRSFFEDDREAMHQRAKSDPRWMAIRRQTVEHPFGIMKWLMGRARFLVRGIEKAKAELALTVLGFNMKRAITIIGVPTLLQRLTEAAA